MTRAPTSSQATLTQIWSKFEKLEKLRDETCNLSDGDNQASAWSMPVESVSALVEPIDQATTKLAWLTVDIEAADQVDIEIKTRILISCIIDKDADLVTALAKSLLRDVTRDKGKE